jgi:L-lactate dehydrogenase complex protein LldG
MPETARQRILDRLRAAAAAGDAAAGRSAAGHAVAGHGGAGDSAAPPDVSVMAAKRWPAAERLPRLRRCMEAVRTEFVEATAATWPAAVREILLAAGARNLMAGEGSPLAAPLQAELAGGGSPSLLLYDRPMEQLKATLFAGVDAGITTCLGGIADTGSLVLRPSPQEPRLLSLLPPLHLVLLDPARIWDTLWQALRELGWAAGMPPNALVISGPSKTADIEQTLAYGVHGPQRLVVVLAPTG